MWLLWVARRPPHLGNPPPPHTPSSRPQGGGDAIRIFFAFSAFFLHFLGRSLSVMFKRKHSSGIV